MKESDTRTICPSAPRDLGRSPGPGNPSLDAIMVAETQAPPAHEAATSTAPRGEESTAGSPRHTEFKLPALCMHTCTQGRHRHALLLRKVQERGFIISEHAHTPPPNR